MSDLTRAEGAAYRAYRAALHRLRREGSEEAEHEVVRTRRAWRAVGDFAAVRLDEGRMVAA